jgi:hypothetical protein
LTYPIDAGMMDRHPGAIILNKETVSRLFRRAAGTNSDQLFEPRKLPIREAIFHRYAAEEMSQARLLQQRQDAAPWR